MRFIDNREIELPNGWVQESEDALKSIQQKKASINELGEVWRKLKDALADLSNDKCWYCETRQERSDDAVDHFRPKNRVSSCTPSHEGYWWLAFNQNNFRYSCTLCNSRRKNPETGKTQGKGDAFPLIEEDKRAYQPNHEKFEEPALLDPCKTSEPGWLDFLRDGTPCAKYPKDKIKRIKVEMAIHYYHLDHPDLIEARRRIGVDIESWIDEANDLFPECHKGNIAIDKAFSGILRNIICSMNEKAPYSAFARRVVLEYRNLEWIDELFQIV